MATKLKNENLQMNYIYIYEGALPKYIKNSLENTMKIDPNANIYFCNDQNYQHENITSVQIESIVSKSTKNILESLIKDKPLKPGSYRGRKNTAPEKKLNTNGENHA